MSAIIDKQSSRRKSIAGLPNSPGLAPQSDTIKVICRFRPPKQIEMEQYGQSNRVENFVLDEDRSSVEAISDVDRRTYTFDKLFGINTVQEQIFTEIEGTVESIMSGFNGTVLACKLPPVYVVLAKQNF